MTVIIDGVKKQLEANDRVFISDAANRRAPLSPDISMARPLSGERPAATGCSVLTATRHLAPAGPAP